MSCPSSSFHQSSRMLDRAIEALHQKKSDTICLGLDRLRAFPGIAQIVTFSVPVVTVTGTNGKGSCVAYLHKICQSAGYRVAAYTSPHMLDFRERLHINGMPLAPERWLDALAFVAQYPEGDALTFFETITLSALWLLHQIQSQAPAFSDYLPVDIILLEVGLGGRLDAVNVVDTDIAVITQIGMDHQAFLGPDREAIGREKAGICRPGRPVVCADPDPPASVLQYVRALGAYYYGVGRAFSLDVRVLPEGRGVRLYWQQTTPCVSNTSMTLSALPALPLPSLACALQVLSFLQKEKGWVVSSDAIQAGIASAHLLGRYHTVSRMPDVIVDVAHNLPAVTGLAHRLRHAAIPGKTVALVGVCRDKPIAAMLQCMQSVVDDCYFVGGLKGSAQRMLPASDLCVLAEKKGIQGQALSGIAKVFSEVIPALESGDRLIVWGSFFTAAAFYRYAKW